MSDNIRHIGTVTGKGIPLEVWQSFDPETLRAALLACFAELCITGARGDGTPYRYDQFELAFVLAPLLAQKLGRQAPCPSS